MSTVDGVIQAMVTGTLCAHMQYLEHHLSIAGNLGQRRMYDTLRKEYYWSHMANDGYTTIAQCMNCARNESKYIHKRTLRLFPPYWPLKFEAMNTLGSLLSAKQENQYVVVETDRCFELTRAFPTAKAWATLVANILLDHRIIIFGIPSHVLSDNGPNSSADAWPSYADT